MTNQDKNSMWVIGLIVVTIIMQGLGNYKTVRSIKKVNIALLSGHFWEYKIQRDTKYLFPNSTLCTYRIIIH